jgi:hypothetical protein
MSDPTDQDVNELPEPYREGDWQPRVGLFGRIVAGLILFAIVTLAAFGVIVWLTGD